MDKMCAAAQQSDTFETICAANTWDVVRIVKTWHAKDGSWHMDLSGPQGGGLGGPLRVMSAKSHQNGLSHVHVSH